MNNNELYHWGVKGQRWGFRRYQNKDGSLTPAGRRRAEKLRQQYLETTGKKLTGYAVRKKGETVKKVDEKKKKKLSEMTDDELKKVVDRMNLENRYFEARKTMSEHAKSKEVSKGKYIVNTIADEMITPAAINVGKQVFSTIFAKTINETFKIEDQYKIYTNNKKKDK